MIVVDVNILAHYVIKGEHTARVHRVWALDDGWIVPVFWRIEFQSILWKYVRVQAMQEDEAIVLLGQAVDLFSANEQDIAGDTALREAMASGITVYDAQYVALARQLNVLCVTLDKPLQKACPDKVISVQKFITSKSGNQVIRETGRRYSTRRETTKHAKMREKGECVPVQL